LPCILVSACLNATGRAAEALAILASMDQTGTDALTQDLAFKLGEHREQTGHRAARGGGQIERFRQGHETYSEMLKFL
jgi:hypothetical protein